ncbi:MAG: hypothetical protein Kow0069_33350 [Promethearchaeota archaeon]
MFVSLVRRFASTFSAALLTFTVSEEVFWSFVRPTDTFSDLLATYLLYSLATYCVLWLVGTCRVRDGAQIILVGAFYGWLVEGLFVYTMYGELPLSISFTGLAWHCLITIYAALYLFQRNFAEGRGRDNLKLGAAFGTAWGAWAVSWQLELGLLPDPIAFSLGALVMCALVFAGHVGLSRAHAGGVFKPSKVEKAVVVCLLATFAYFAFLAVGVLLLAVWAPLQVLTAWALLRGREGREASFPPLPPPGRLTPP